jgi:lysozyme
MKLSINGLRLIKDFEGCRLHAYRDSAGVWTIGYGHTPGVKQGDVIDKVEAEGLLLEDSLIAEDAVNRLVKVHLSQYQFDSLVSLVFNIGETAFARSTLLRKLNAGDYHGAAEEFSRWVHGGEDKHIVMGLVGRRRKEQSLFKLDLPATEDIVLAIGEEMWMVTTRRVRISKGEIEYRYRFADRILVFRDSETWHPVYKCRIFQLDDDVPAET